METAPPQPVLPLQYDTDTGQPFLILVRALGWLVSIWSIAKLAASSTYLVYRYVELHISMFSTSPRIIANDISNVFAVVVEFLGLVAAQLFLRHLTSAPRLLKIWCICTAVQASYVFVLETWQRLSVNYGQVGPQVLKSYLLISDLARFVGALLVPALAFILLREPQVKKLFSESIRPR